jgi:hypothetical protein
MADQLDNIQILDSGFIRGLSSADNLQITATMEFQADVVIDANLSVTGTTTSVESETTRYTDNHLYLNDGYTTVSAQTGGLVVNYLPTATTDTVAATGFVAGVAATSNPTIITTGSGTFSVGNLVQVSGASNVANNGLYEVLTHTGTTLTLRGVGTTATVEDFTQNQLVTDTTVAGTITLVNVSVLRSGVDGVWETGLGSSTPVSFTDLGSGSGNSLQQAYVAGNQITTSVGEGDVIIAGTEQLNITATGGIDIDTQLDFDGTVFDVQMTSTNGFSIDGTAASNVTADTGNLTLSTTTSGSLILDGVALLDINAGANMDVDVTGTYDLLASSTFSIDGTGASNVTATSGNLTLSTATSGDVVLSSAANIDADAAAVTVDATAGISLDAATASNFTVTTGALTIETVTSGDLTLSTTTAGDILLSGAAEIDITPAGLLDINAGANMDVDVTGTYDLLASSTFSIDGTGASNVTATSGNLTLSTVTSGGIVITSAGDSTYTVPANSATAFGLTDGTDTFINVDSTNGFEALDLGTHVNLVEGAGIELDTSSATSLVAGDLVSLNVDGDLTLSDADNGSLRASVVVGVSRATFGTSTTSQIFSVPGSLVPVRFTSAPAAANNGSRVFLSTTAGQATLTAPAGSGTVTYQIGWLQGANGVSTTPLVLYMPMLISQHPSVTTP